MRFITWTAFAILLASPTAAIGADKAPVKQYLVRASMRDIPSKGSPEKEKILSEPNFMVLANDDADFCVGGEMTVGGNRVPYGTLAKIKVVPIEANKIRVTGMFEVSTVGSLDDGMLPRESNSVHFAKAIACGDTIRACVSRSTDCERWFELVVEELKPEKVGNVRVTPTFQLPTKSISEFDAEVNVGQSG
jgi:hypothetical protein